ncbi:protein phosphatase 1 regulatory subunit 36 isoform X2 [Sphaeramia orbicularis]|nr:protein phosphatase 1 regulatory subunit 36 isoform X2 [Sphaeramia orbicularis]
MVMQKQEDHVTIDDVKQVAVSLLQENYPIPIPSCFLTILKSKALDEVLSSLLWYMSCFFEHKSLENKPNPLMVLDNRKENQIMAQSLAIKDHAQKKLAVCYFTLIMDLEMGQHQHISFHKGRMSSDSTEWLLQACLYTFFCYVAWVTFGRKDLKDIHEEVGRLLYSDIFNTAVRNRNDGYSRRTSNVINGSAKVTGADPKETGWNSTLKQRSSHRRPALNSVVNQCSPLMVSLLPSPKEQSPHLFLRSRVRSEKVLQAKNCETQALKEVLNQQATTTSIGILGRPLKQLNPTTLIPYGEQRNNKDKDWDKAPGNDSQYQ